MTATLLTFPVFRAFDSNGAPLAGGLLYSYQAGTTTPLATYVDQAGVTQNTNPVVLDSTGTANVWLGSSTYKLVLKDKDGVQQWSVDNVEDSSTIVLSDLANTSDVNKGDALVGVKSPLTGASARTQHEKNQDYVTPEDFGAIGNGIADDTSAFSSAAPHGFRAKSGKTYVISDTITLSDGVVYDFNGATLKATTGLANKPMLSISNAASCVIKNVYLEGNNIAKRGIYASHMNQTTSSIVGVTVHKCTENGFHLIACQDTIFDGLYSLSNGGHGFYIESCNASTMTASEANNNLGDGFYICRGTTNFSGGMNLVGTISQYNNGNGVTIFDTQSQVHLTDHWSESNNGHEVYSNGYATVQNNLLAGSQYIFDQATDSYTTTEKVDKYSIYVDNDAKGNYTNNTLAYGGGFDGAHVYFDNTDISDDWAAVGIVIEPNYSANQSVSAISVAVAKELYVITNNEVCYHAIKKISSLTNTSTYTPVLTAGFQSSIEVNIYSMATFSGAQGQTIMKTWTSADVDSRTSFAEIGGATNPWANGVFYMPVYLAGHAFYVRWNGNDLEIKPYGAYDYPVSIEVKAYTASSAFQPTWLV